MFALKVESGTEPSKYPSVRAISTPPNRPETEVLIPFTPAFKARRMANFCTVLNDARLVICSPIQRATRVASASGLRTSTTLTLTFKFLSLAVFFTVKAIFSMFFPSAPNTIAGRAVRIIKVISFLVRSISIFDTAASFNKTKRLRRILISWFNHFTYSSFSAYQRFSQSLTIPKRKAFGDTFCPIILSPSYL